jgi:hypothetical protein
MTEFRHKIGDALYEFDDGDYDGNGQPDRVRVWPVIKITDRFIYVRHPMREYTTTYRLDREELEREGRISHRRAFRSLYVRPKLDWPMAVISVSAPGQLAIGPGSGDRQ